MCKFKGFVQIVLLYLLIVRVEVVNGCGCFKDVKMLNDDDDITKLPSEETKRTPKECEAYKKKLFATFSNLKAIDENLNFIMTGQICASGFGSIYEA